MHWRSFFVAIVAALFLALLGWWLVSPAVGRSPAPEQLVHPHPHDRQALPQPQAEVSHDHVAELQQALLDTGRPFAQRQVLLQEGVGMLGPEIVPLLMDLGDSEILLRRYAIAAMGTFDQSDVRAYLQQRRAAGDPEVVLGVASAFKTLDGSDSLATLSEILRLNRVRDDGYQDLIANHIIALVLELSDPAGAEVLIRHLADDAHIRIGHEHAVTVAEALASLGNPKARTAIHNYRRILLAWIEQQEFAEQGQRSAQALLRRLDTALEQLGEPAPAE